MSMFDNYEDLNDNYIPNNSDDPSFNIYTITDNIIPREVKNIKGEVIGISWKQFEDVSLYISVDNKLFVEPSAIVLEQSGQTPQASLTPQQISGVVIGTRCYNTDDAKSWTCTSLDTNTRKWKQDTVLTTPSTGTIKEFRNQEFNTQSMINFEINIFNFRFEKVIPSIVPNSFGRNISLSFTSEQNKKLIPGTYKIVVTASQESTKRVVMEKYLIIQQGDEVEYNV